MFTINRITLAAAIIVSLLIQPSYANEDTKIAFASLRVGNRDIYIVDGNVNNQSRLTIHPKDDYNPTWSPDGKRIAFVSIRNENKPQIWVIGLDAKDAVRITDGTNDDYPDWTFNGDRIVYQSHHSYGGTPQFELRVVNSDGSNNTLLMETNSIHPCWSPGGTRVIFSYSRDFETNQIYSIDFNGNNLTQLTFDDEYKRYPSFSSNGKKIAYTGKQHIWVMDSDGMNQKKLTKRNTFIDEHPTWSPDSEKIAFHAMRNQVDGLAIFALTMSSNRVHVFIDVHGGSNQDADWYHPGPLAVSPVDTKVTIWGRLKSGQW